MGLITKLAWVALPALAGCGVLSQVSSQGTGTNPGGKASGFGVSHLTAKKPSSGNSFGLLPVSSGLNINPENTRKLNSNGLPFPELPQGFGYPVAKDYSWDAHFKNPGSARKLPYYEKVPVQEINRQATEDIWKLAADIKHVKNDTVPLGKKLIALVDKYISGLGYKPTPAHRWVLLDAALQRFIYNNVTYGAADASVDPVLAPDSLVPITSSASPAAPGFAKAFLKQDKLQGGCVDLVYFTLGMHSQMGIISRHISVTNRREWNETVDTGNFSTRNHAIVGIYLPTRREDAPDLKKFDYHVMNGNGFFTPAALQIELYHNFANIALTDPTAFSMKDGQTRNEATDVMPNRLLSRFMVGAKGDDFFRVLANARWPSSTPRRIWRDGPNRMENFYAVENLYGVGNVRAKTREQRSAPLPEQFKMIFEEADRFEQGR